MTKRRASDGTLMGAYTVGDYPGAVAFDGTSIWVARANNHTVIKL